MVAKPGRIVTGERRKSLSRMEREGNRMIALILRGIEILMWAVVCWVLLGLVVLVLRMIWP
jgi:hypothetical protein